MARIEFALTMQDAAQMDVGDAPLRSQRLNGELLSADLAAEDLVMIGALHGFSDDHNPIIARLPGGVNH